MVGDAGYESDVTEVWDKEPNWDEDSLLPEADEEWAPYGRSSSACFNKLQKPSDDKSVDTVTVTSSASDFTSDSSIKIHPVLSQGSMQSRRTTLGSFFSDRGNEKFASSIPVEPVRSELRRRTLGGLIESSVATVKILTPVSPTRTSCSGLNRWTKFGSAEWPSSERKKLCRYLNDSSEERDPFTVQDRYNKKSSLSFTPGFASSETLKTMTQLFSPMKRNTLGHSGPKRLDTDFQSFSPSGRFAQTPTAANKLLTEFLESHRENEWANFASDTRKSAVETSPTWCQSTFAGLHGFSSHAPNDRQAQPITAVQQLYKGDLKKEWDPFKDHSKDAWERHNEPIWNNDEKENNAYDTSPVKTEPAPNTLRDLFRKKQSTTPEKIPVRRRRFPSFRSPPLKKKEAKLTWTREPSSNFSDCVLIVVTGWSERDCTETFHAHKSVVGLGPRGSDALLRHFQSDHGSNQLSGSPSSPIIELDPKIGKFFPQVLDYMYSFEDPSLNMTPSNIGAFHRLSTQLQITSLTEQVDEFIRENLREETMEKYLKSAHEYQNQELLDQVMGVCNSPQSSRDEISSITDDDLMSFVCQRLSL